MQGVSVSTLRDQDRFNVLYRYGGSVVRNYVNPLPTSNLVNNLVPLRRTKGDHYYKNPLNAPIVAPALLNQAATLLQNNGVQSAPAAPTAIPAATSPGTPMPTTAPTSPATTQPNSPMVVEPPPVQFQDAQTQTQAGPTPAQVSEMPTQTDQSHLNTMNQGAQTEDLNGHKEHGTQTDLPNLQFGGTTTIDISQGPIPPPSAQDEDMSQALVLRPATANDGPLDQPRNSGVTWIERNDCPGVVPAAPPFTDPVRLLKSIPRVTVPSQYLGGNIFQSPTRRGRGMRGANRLQITDGSESDDLVQIGGVIQIPYGSGSGWSADPNLNEPGDEVGEPTGTLQFVQELAESDFGDANSEASGGTRIGASRKTKEGQDASQREKQPGRDKAGQALHGKSSESQRLPHTDRPLNKKNPGRKAGGQAGPSRKGKEKEDPDKDKEVGQKRGRS